MSFVKAVRGNHVLRAAAFGPSGAGKTRFALELAKALCPEGKRIALIDTEGGRAREFAGLYDFDHADLKSFAAEDFIRMMGEAHKSDLYGALVIDSLSAFWQGAGGILDQVDSGSDKTLAVWAKMNPKIRLLLDALLRYPAHVIVTMRAKTEWVESVDARGKRNFVPAGKGPTFKDGSIYEFSFVAQLGIDHSLTVLKSPPGSGLDQFTGDSLAPIITESLEGWVKGEVYE